MAVRVGRVETELVRVAVIERVDVVEEVLVRLDVAVFVLELVAEADLELVEVLVLVEEVVLVRLWRAVRVEEGEGRGLWEARAERVAERVEVALAVGRAPNPMRLRGCCSKAAKGCA